MRYSMFLLFFLLFSLSLIAQEAPTQHAGFFRFQFQTVDFEQFNRQAVDLGFPALQNTLTEWGITYQNQNGQWLNGLGLGVGLGNAGGDLNGRTSRYRHLGIRLATTYDLFASPDLVLGPTITAQVQYNRLVLSDPAIQGDLARAFEAGYLLLTTWETPVQLGLTLQHRFDLGLGNGGLIGLNLGYTLADREDWRVAGAVPFSDPGIRLGGWFGAAQLGFLLGK